VGRVDESGLDVVVTRSDVSDVHAFARREDDVRLFTALD